MHRDINIYIYIGNSDTKYIYRLIFLLYIDINICFYVVTQMQKIYNDLFSFYTSRYIYFILELRRKKNTPSDNTKIIIDYKLIIIIDY